MTRLNLLQRAALSVYVLPFFVGGIILGTVLYSWLSQYAHFAVWLWPLLFVFAAIGILLGALIAYFMLMFILFWLVPDRPLLADDEAVSPTMAQRALFPLFHAVHKLARWLAPRAT